jgi:hypothetical protein
MLQEGIREEKVMHMAVPRKVTERDEFGKPVLKFGELYSYQLVNYAFLGPREVKGTRYIVYARGGNGNVRWFRAMDKEGAIASYQAALKADPKMQEATMNINDPGVISQISPIEKWKAEFPVDLGPALILGGMAGTQGIAEWWGNITTWWGKLMASMPFQIR